jgi:hypothetical protein
MLDAGAVSKTLDKPPDADSARAVAIDLAAVIAVSAGRAGHRRRG